MSDRLHSPRVTVRPGAIPAELRGCPQWVAWQYEDAPGRPKPAKVPIHPRTGRRADVTDARCGGPLPDALAAVIAGRADGVGFVFRPTDPYAGVDLDDCRDPATGVLEGWAAEAVARLDSYTEVSPSGRGVRVFVRGALDPTGRCRHGPVEVYDRGRYLTVTGHALPGFPADVRNRGPQLLALQASLVNPKQRAAKADCSRAIGVDSDELLRRARGAANGEKFERLWAGDSTGYPSASEGDLALAAMLVFWCDGDVARADAVFRTSARMRPKWDERRGRETYGERTLRAALASARLMGGADAGRDHRADSPEPQPLCSLVTHLARSDDRAEQASIGAEIRSTAAADPDWAALVGRCGGATQATVAAVGRELGRRAGGPFFLSGRVAGLVVGAGATWGSVLLRRLVAGGVFERVAAARHQAGRAAEYLFRAAESATRS